MNEVIEACETISVSENQANQLFNAYVNEQQHQLEVFQKLPEFEFLIVDVMGKVIYTASLNCGFHVVDISGFEPGIYIAIGQTQGSQTDVKKIIVK